MKKLLKLKTELAGFLQQTVGELAKDVKKSSSGEVADEAKALQVFLSDVREGKNVRNADIVKFARLFNDELTLDNLDRVHLLTLCQVRQLFAAAVIDIVKGSARINQGMQWHFVRSSWWPIHRSAGAAVWMLGAVLRQGDPAR